MKWQMIKKKMKEKKKKRTKKKNKNTKEDQNKNQKKTKEPKKNKKEQKIGKEKEKRQKKYNYDQGPGKNIKAKTKNINLLHPRHIENTLYCLGGVRILSILFQARPERIFKCLISDFYQDYEIWFHIEFKLQKHLFESFLIYFEEKQVQCSKSEYANFLSLINFKKLIWCIPTLYNEENQKNSTKGKGGILTIDQIFEIRKIILGIIKLYLTETRNFFKFKQVISICLLLFQEKKKINDILQIIEEVITKTILFAKKL
ncbi:hypothetical protein M0813_07339 [Anaeramoeba flamelloides]|uniref:Uncharacterized protein n=1 Tax=Anaeramoeba flamelloides TaxID=1746091 RepID=A0ABQ8XAN7_9EUKA|nr:hypothetical protein M0813_07339 [Anaeramoeba flamelloides]